MIDCGKAGEIIEKREFEKLSWLQKRRLRLHLKVCGLCKKYEDDNKVLNVLIKMIGVKAHEKCLSEKQKEEMKAVVAREGDHPAS